MFPGRIVVADHEGQLDRFIFKVLNKDKYAIELVETCFDLEKSIYSNAPHIVVVNAHLPDLNVVKFMKGLKERFGDMRPSVILAVQKHTDRFLSKAYNAGVDEFLVAPFHAVELATRLAKFLERAALIFENAQLTQEVQDLSARESSIRKKRDQDIDEKLLVPQGESNLEFPPLQDDSDEEPRNDFIPEIAKQVEETAAFNIPSSDHQTSDIGPITISAAPIFKKNPNTLVASNLDLGMAGPPPRRVSRSVAKPINHSQHILRPATLLVARLNLSSQPMTGDAINQVQTIMQELNKVINQSGGGIVSQTGERLLAAFAPSPQLEQHQLAAIYAALEMQLVCMQNQSQSDSYIDLSVAIHSSEVHYGTESTGRVQVWGPGVAVVQQMINQCEWGDVIMTADALPEMDRHVLADQAEPIPFGQNWLPVVSVYGVSR